MRGREGWVEYHQLLEMFIKELGLNIIFESFKSVPCIIFKSFSVKPFFFKMAGLKSVQDSISINLIEPAHPFLSYSLETSTCIGGQTYV